MACSMGREEQLEQLFARPSGALGVQGDQLREQDVGGLAGFESVGMEHGGAEFVVQLFLSASLSVETFQFEVQ